MTTETTEELVLRYWRSWQTPSDFDAMEACLAPDVSMDLGVAKVDSAKAFRGFVESNPAPWTDVRLVDSHFAGDTGTIVYEGTNTADGSRMRVAELCRVRDGQITQVTSVLTQLPPAS